MSSAPDPMEQAKKAKERSRAGFLDTVALGQSVRQVVDIHDAHIRRNHFGEDLSYLWGGGKK